MTVANSAVNFRAAKKAQGKPVRMQENERQQSDLCEAINQGLKDIAKGDFVTVRRRHIDEDVHALFSKFKKR